MRFFSEVCVDAKDSEAISVQLTRLCCDIGIRNWYVGTLVHESDLQRVGWGKFGMALGWQEVYAQERYSDTDAVFRYAKTQLTPATWSDIRCTLDNSEEAVRVFEHAKSFGLHDGYIKPVREGGELPAAVTFGGAEIDASIEGLMAMELLAAYAYEGLRRHSQGFKPIEPHLSPREYEVLCWTAEGKSAWDISGILGVGEQTIRDYQKSLRSKYNCSSMTRVVVIAALSRTIKTLPSLACAA